MSGKQDAMVVHALFSSVVPTHRASSHTAAEGASARAQLLLRRTARRQPVLLLVPCHPAHESYSSVPYLFGNEVKKFFVDRSHLGSLPMTHMIMDEGEDSKGKSVKTDLSLVLNMFSFQSHFVCAKKKKEGIFGHFWGRQKNPAPSRAGPNFFCLRRHFSFFAPQKRVRRVTLWCKKLHFYTVP